MGHLNTTREFLGDETQRAAAKFELYDVQGLWGGRIIYAGSLQRAVVRLIQPGMFERRYEFAPGDELRQILDLFVEHDFLTIQPAERPGIPDEARPRITLENAAGDKRSASKWARVKDERFDAIYRALLHLEEFTHRIDPVYSGPYEFDS
jgi:hypothetical protein